MHELDKQDDSKKFQKDPQPTSIAGEFGGDSSEAYRLVIDCRAVNEYIELDLHPVLLLQEQDAVLAGYPFQMSLDIYKGLWQISLQWLVPRYVHDHRFGRRMEAHRDAARLT